MYSVYAADPQMRLNVGIRRRLAPLVENSRRRIELLHAMLFSFPGTPILYYGDEIGMGDNIYLGDRNGVRTPMQWTSDRNAGFSRADAARLYAPPIQDPVYGYQAINVEAQERYPFSLLNWMKRLVAMRRQHRVFGRGTIEFVGSPNRKVLAYLRRDDRETILCVVNLSRTVQPAELELQAFGGMLPVEMNGLTEFPRIADDKPYLLTLGPYAAYWFTLQHEPVQRSPRAAVPADPTSAVIEQMPALLMGVEWQNVLDAGTRTVLEKQALAPFLQRQRWFASKSRTIRQTRFSDWTRLRGGAEPSFAAVASVEYTDGWVESYLVPLALVGGDAAENALRNTPSNVMARITGARKGAIVDGVLDDGTCDALVDIIRCGDARATARGSIRAAETPAPIELPVERRWVRGGGDQSNSIAFLNDRYALKVFRRIEPTPNPEFEIGSFLTARGFTRIPPLAGALEYLRAGLEPGTLAVVQGLVKNQGSGWEVTIDDLRRYYERVSARVKRSDWQEPRDRSEARDEPARSASAASAALAAPPPFFTALENWYLLGAATLGRRTAEMHLTLASDRSNPAFAPERLDAAALESVASDMRAHAAASLDRLADKAGTLPEPARPHADAVLAARARLLAGFERLRTIADAGERIRVHGDYHLGQVLRTEEDFVILDFEGEPARSIAERRAKQSPLKDVAGMMRSFGYAAYAALFAFTVHAPDDYTPLEPWAEAWEHWASDAFLREYMSTVGDAPVVARDADARRQLLAAFMLDKALYELSYELNNRPDWVAIPLLGIRKLLTDAW
jgi:maltose alpha-D-glucosyltransferase/alpha-amylase